MPKKILIIDDDASSNDVAARFLRSVGFEVVTTESPFSTAALITAEHPDLVLVDVRMPGLSGDSLVRIAKGRPGGTRCPFVLYSTSDPVSLAVLVKQCGADGYIHKSGRLKELAAAVRSYVAVE